MNICGRRTHQKADRTLCRVQIRPFLPVQLRRPLVLFPVPPLFIPVAIDIRPDLFRQTPHSRRRRRRGPLLLDPLRHAIRHALLHILFPHFVDFFRYLIQRPILFEILYPAVKRRKLRFEDQTRHCRFGKVVRLR